MHQEAATNELFEPSGGDYYRYNDWIIISCARMLILLFIYSYNDDLCLMNFFLLYYVILILVVIYFKTF